MRSGQFQNVRFRDAQALAEALGYRLRSTRGSHHTYRHPKAQDLLNLQPTRGRQAKPYQLRQLLEDVGRYDLSLEARP
ncbi:MAG: type II toxin-antitoxin system HicA family toxin [Acidimicrobiia bacterium]